MQRHRLRNQAGPPLPPGRCFLRAWAHELAHSAPLQPRSAVRQSLVCRTPAVRHAGRICVPGLALDSVPPSTPSAWRSRGPYHTWMGCIASIPASGSAESLFSTPAAAMDPGTGTEVVAAATPRGVACHWARESGQPSTCVLSSASPSHRSTCVRWPFTPRGLAVRLEEGGARFRLFVGTDERVRCFAYSGPGLDEGCLQPLWIARSAILAASWAAPTHSLGGVLAAGCRSGEVLTWDARAARPSRLLDHGAAVTSVSAHPAMPSELLVAGIGGRIARWDVRQPTRAVVSYRGGATTVTSAVAAWSPCARWVVGRAAAESLAVWDREEREPVHHVSSPGMLDTLAWLPSSAAPASIRTAPYGIIVYSSASPRQE